ncbi:hypothetical protein CCAN2_1130004 [Capnocytophaga canimorsus]|uniref:Uncharacterized protein n=1 Tax=Capnocytophaga canimorsus TaxID=28188 RepID=A0A0B7ISZ2_9FLAO|nr:hypothetical protein CCAN2_1130004 [Capnocytophaga canimorsus]CEN53093.1 hypothetical protein CCAN11_490002 [Capnocytophaga canimorsus]
MLVEKPISVFISGYSMMLKQYSFAEKVGNITLLKPDKIKKNAPNKERFFDLFIVFYR